MNTTLLLTISAGSIAAVVLLCIIFNKLSRKEPKQCEINDSMLREMLMQNGCRILDDVSNFDWIEFVYQSHNYSIRGCGNFCEIRAGILLRDGYYQPELIKNICEGEMMGFTCGHIWYDKEKNGLIINVFSIQKSYEHLKMSFGDMIEYMHYMYSAFYNIYHEKANYANATNCVVS